MKQHNAISPFPSGLTAFSRHSRRRFIRNFALGTAVSTFMGEAWLGTVLAECQPTQPGDGILQLKIADFPPLQAENGSLRLVFNPFTVSGPTGAFYPVLINRGANNQFFTLSTQCQHLGCVVPTYNAAAGASTCPCHGSQYGIDGRVLRGPTVKPLIAYSNSFDGTTLCVEMPGIGFSVKSLEMQSGAGPRFQLSFPTKSKVKYQVLFRQTIADPGAVVSFATKLDVAAGKTELTGDGSTAEIFVDRINDRGFYSISMMVAEG